MAGRKSLQVMTMSSTIRLFFFFGGFDLVIKLVMYPVLEFSLV